MSQILIVKIILLKFYKKLFNKLVSDLESLEKINLNNSTPRAKGNSDDELEAFEIEGLEDISVEKGVKQIKLNEIK